MQIKITAKKWNGCKYDSVMVMLAGNKELIEKIKALIEKDEELDIE